ncbi:MAG: superoxide dismutase [Porphyromonadaceae bacterium CG2_30_38_12]|nr:MAG: superoxide dismutase [Porphyromonadaceae bacterium CG2_30_38_12]
MLFASAQFKLPALPYAYGALEPYIDSTTMRIHHDVHHAAYVKNLNKALEKYSELYKKDLTELLGEQEDLPMEIQTAVRNNGGGVYNHNFFWKIMAPAGSTKISTKLEATLIGNFGGVEAFKEAFEKAALSRFGSGWVWLVASPSGKLQIISTPNQDNLYSPGSNPKLKAILCLDVWEHAYYIKYQAKRAAYAKAFWNVVNWAEVEKLLNEPYN